MFILYYLLIISLVYLPSFIVGLSTKARNWDYQPIATYCNSSNEALIFWDLNIKRIGRGDSAISGTITVNVDITDEYFIEVLIYRALTGSNDILIPMRVRKVSFPVYISKTYPKLFMRSVANCSNLPQEKNGDPVVLFKNIYTLDMCKISTENFPSHMQKGVYKIQFIGTGPVQLFCQMLIEVED